MKLLVVLLAALALASAANAQQQRCPLTAADVSGLDFKPVAPACNGLRGTPDASACDTCGAALAKAFVPAFAKLGASCDTLPTDQNAITNAITPCVNIVLPGLQRAGVNVNSLLALRQCPSNLGPQLQAVVQANCPGTGK